MIPSETKAIIKFITNGAIDNLKDCEKFLKFETVIKIKRFLDKWERRIEPEILKKL